MFGGKTYFLVGIKGTGMAALAELLVSWGAEVTGSDVPDRFYTDEILESLGITVAEGFSVENLPAFCDEVVYSAAYDPEHHEELLAAGERGIPLTVYPEFLGKISSLADSSAVAGVHGKTTTTALAGTLLKKIGFPVSVLVGSAVSGFGGRSTYIGGERYFLAETCEYRRHFLHFRPRQIVLTSVEPDHLDYFTNYEDIKSAFVEFAGLLPEDGTLIYCADDPGAVEVAEEIRVKKPGVRRAPYGESAEGDFKVERISLGEGFSSFSMPAFSPDFKVRVPGKHNILNAAAGLALVSLLLSREKLEATPEMELALREALYSFSGSKRRSEILGEAAGILFIDDYGHHPTAIASTLEGFRSFFPGRRIVIDFMSHTYSRTRALLEEFGPAFAAADRVVLHQIYASAREDSETAESEKIDGRELKREVEKNHPEVGFYEDFDSAFRPLTKELKPGDLFITMGAGDNWKLGERLYRHFARAEGRSFP